MNTLLVMVFPTLLATASRNAGFQTRYDQRVDEQAQEIEFFLDTHIVGEVWMAWGTASGHLDDLAVRCK